MQPQQNHSQLILASQNNFNKNKRFVSESRSSSTINTNIDPYELKVPTYDNES